MKPLHLIDQFYRPGTYDAYTFVFDERDPRTGYYTMLALSEDDGYAVSDRDSGDCRAATDD